ncbi:MAG: hypothetical protein IH840_13590 [Candidatus Heimdallarchaeota archaeon]|nr:hypothetical protein [Candidatus Heimdallarchaeota archaeon]
MSPEGEELSSSDKERISPVDWRQILLNYEGKFTNVKPAWIPDELVLSCLPTLVRTHHENDTVRADGTIILVKMKDWTFLVTAAHCIFDNANDFSELFIGFQSQIVPERYFLPLSKISEMGGKWIYDKNHEKDEHGLRKRDIAILPIVFEKSFLNLIVHEFLDSKYQIEGGIHLNNFQEGIHYGFGNAMSGKTTSIDQSKAKSLGMTLDEILNLQKIGMNLFLPIASRAQIQDLDPYKKGKTILPITSIGLPGFSGGPLFIKNNGIPNLFGVVIRTGTKNVFNPEKESYDRYVDEKTSVIVWDEVIKLVNEQLPEFEDEDILILKKEHVLHGEVEYIGVDDFIIKIPKNEIQRYESI